MKKRESAPVGQKCSTPKYSTTERHLRELAQFRRKLKAEMRRAGKGGEGEFLKTLPLYLKVVTMEQELLGRKMSRGKEEDASPQGSAPLSEEDWDMLAKAVDARRKARVTQEAQG